MKQIQRELVKSKLEKTGRVSRNWAIQNYITRLSAIIHTLRHSEHLPIDGKYVGSDYIYELKAH